VAHSGASILRKSTTPHQHLNLNTNLQAVAVRIINLKKTTAGTVCSIYLPPSLTINTNELHNLIAQLSHRFYLLATLMHIVPSWDVLN